MSSTEPSSTNISTKFFDQSYQIKNQSNQHIANVFYSKTDRMSGPLGTLFTVHGYGGSPVEFCLKMPTERALANGFDVIACESVQLSATDGRPKSLSEMTLNNHRQAIFLALASAFLNKKIRKSDFRLIAAHSMGSRSICDLLMRSKLIQNYFDRYYVLNPFFLPPKRLQKAYSKPEVWSRICSLPQTENRIIEGNQYSVPTCTGNYYVDLPKEFGAGVSDINGITQLVSKSLADSHVAFVLGEKDLPSYDNYNMNVKIYDGMNIRNKELFVVPGADHYFENARTEFCETFSGIISSLRDQRMNRYVRTA
jgi:hypothetical protein